MPNKREAKKLLAGVNLALQRKRRGAIAVDFIELKGDKGDSPTDQELIKLIIPLIPKPIHGKTPTKEEILHLLRPLIPEAKEGKKPSDDELLALIKPLIPKPLKPKDGKTPTDNKLKALIKPLIPEPQKGDPGTNGSPDTGQEIVDKINELDIRIGLQIAWQHIEGLEELIENLTNRIRTADANARNALAMGGMGIPLSESFDGDGSTVKFPLKKDVGGEGKALWVYYNGAWLVPTTHFTITGRKNLNIVALPDGESAPPTNTVVDVLYLPSE